MAFDSTKRRCSMDGDIGSPIVFAIVCGFQEVFLLNCLSQAPNLFVLLFMYLFITLFYIKSDRNKHHYPSVAVKPEPQHQLIGINISILEKEKTSSILFLGCFYATTSHDIFVCLFYFDLVLFSAFNVWWILLPDKYVLPPYTHKILHTISREPWGCLWLRSPDKSQPLTIKGKETWLCNSGVF